MQNLSLGFGGPPLFSGVCFDLAAGERAGLVGRNGTGKSSLLRAIAGVHPVDSGEISRLRNQCLAFLPQQVPADLKGPVAQVVAEGLAGIDTPEWEKTARLERILSRLNLSGGARVEDCSAGMRRRALLARVLIAEPDLLILDEPTNHLDIAAIEELESVLTQSFRGALLFVTHDRAFLSRVATRILDLDYGELRAWNCPFPVFRERKEAWLKERARENALFDRKLAEEERWIRRGIQARRTRNEGRVRALDAMRRERQERHHGIGRARITVPEGSRSGDKVITCEGLSFAYPGQPALFSGLDLRLTRGDRLGIVGANGTGKTTLLQVLLQHIPPTAGSVQHGTALEVCYFDQLRASLDPSKTVIETIAGGSDTVNIAGQSRHVVTYLRDFLFPPDRARSPVSCLSGGECNRLLLALLFAQPSNLLVLDEPTNDLDLETLELLEEVLSDYPGTVLLVSHDRAFLDAVVTEMVVLEGDGRTVKLYGGYRDYQPPPPPVAPPPPPAAKSSRRRFLNRERWELERLPGEIEALEEEHQQLAAELADPQTYKDGGARPATLRARLAELAQAQEEKFARWEALEQKRQSCDASPG